MSRYVPLPGRTLDGQKQIGCALDLVDDRLVKPAHQPGRIGFRGRQGRRVVKRQIGPGFLREGAGEGGLACLPGSGQHDHPGILQGLMDAMGCMTKKHGGLKPNQHLNERVWASI